MAISYSDMVNRRTCVYRAYDADQRLLYVGISVNLDGRLSKHHSSAWWPAVVEIAVQWFEGREAAKAAERRAISEEHPIYNVSRPTRGPRIREVRA